MTTWEQQAVKLPMHLSDRNVRLTEMGADGWELVAVHVDPRSTVDTIAYLKRPTPGAPAAAAVRAPDGSLIYVERDRL